ncbi:MAG: hypothetical protein KDA96_23185 [Planctomycetaceae bacterium]|nr:hypothetical protein [Planctomycetaceae bacterium]
MAAVAGRDSGFLHIVEINVLLSRLVFQSSPIREIVGEVGMDNGQFVQHNAGTGVVGIPAGEKWLGRVRMHSKLWGQW